MRRNKEENMRKAGKKIISLVLVLSLALSGCGKEEVKKEITKEQAASVDNGKLKGDSKVIAVGKTTVTYNEYQTYSYMLQNGYTTLLDGNVWNYSVSAGRTIGMDAIEDTIRMIIQIKVIGKCAANVGVTLGANEKEQLAYEAEKYVQTVPEDVRNQYGMTAQLVTDMLCDNEIARKVYDVTTGQVDVAVSDEEAQVVEAQVICLLTKGIDKNGVNQNLDEAGKTALFETAKQLREQAKSGGFYALAEANSSRSDICMNIGKEDKPKELVDAAFALKEGDISEVITASDGYYIINCLSVNKESVVKEHREELAVERRNKAFQDSYKAWAEKFGVHVSRSLLK